MKVNILELVVIGITILFAAWGFYRGFVKKLASMISLVLSIVLVSFLFPYMADFLQNHTPVYSFITSQCENIVTSDAFLNTDDSERTKEEAEKEIDGFGRIEQTEFIQGLPIPKLLKELLEDNNNKDGYRSLNANGFREYLVHFIARIIMNIVTFVAALLIVQLIIWGMIATLNVISHLPGISLVNRAAGLALGLVQALFWLWLFFLILSMMSGTQIGAQLFGMIKSSKILSFAYEQNLFMRIVVRTAAIFA